ncbi:MAG: RdgB/HAM1 family non-canonical purine NTP pyrophosphatase [Nitrososphaerota archaeon]|nr:RdgB/HAM1 family non-canonical purine NTP pyrophosphatase [Nitrososphaerota archaeon]
MKHTIWFATSNEGKFREASDILKAYEITLKRLTAKGAEVQSNDVSEIVTRAADETFALANKPLIAEDTGLFIDELGGFPGVYAAFVTKTIGSSGVLKLLEGRKSKAHFVTAVAYKDRTSTRVFTGVLDGTIITSARGDNGFGFDPIFMPAGYRETLAQMTSGEKNAISHRSRALNFFGRWYKTSKK